MKQRLALARTLVHDPALLILDEPASGLDPRARIELRELLKELRLLGKTILISSHILTELAEMCTHIGIIERGRLLVSGSIGRDFAADAAGAHRAGAGAGAGRAGHGHDAHGARRAGCDLAAGERRRRPARGNRRRGRRPSARPRPPGAVPDGPGCCVRGCWAMSACSAPCWRPWSAPRCRSTASTKKSATWKTSSCAPRGAWCSDQPGLLGDAPDRRQPDDQQGATRPHAQRAVDCRAHRLSDVARSVRRALLLDHLRQLALPQPL